MADLDFIDGLTLSDMVPRRGRLVRKDAGEGGAKPGLPANLQAAVDAGSILSFVSGLTPEERDDVLYSVQLASRAADGVYNRTSQIKEWYSQYTRVLEGVGWAIEQFAFASHDQAQGDFRMDKAALGVISAIATGNQLGVLTASISALEKLAENDRAITLLSFQATKEGSGNFQLGAVQKENGALSMALGAFYFKAAQEGGKFLFFTWGGKGFEFWTSAQKMTLNAGIYARARQKVVDKLGAGAPDFVAALNLDSKPGS